MLSRHVTHFKGSERGGGGGGVVRKRRPREIGTKQTGAGMQLDGAPPPVLVPARLLMQSTEQVCTC